jgi:hypothetical protein
MYNTAVDHPKVMMLTDANFRAWVRLMSLASKLDGKIPADMPLIATTLRKPAGKAADIVQVLQSAVLLDPVEGEGWVLHNWKEKQFKSDVSTGRVRAFRERYRNVSETAQRQSTETESKKKERAASAAVPAPKPVLPDWINQESWAGWTEMRRKIKNAPFTDRAEKLAISELEKLRAEGHNPTQILDLATQKGWKSFYPPKTDMQNGRREKPASAHDNHNAGTVLYLEKLERESRGQGADSDAADPPRKLLLAP